MASTQQVQLPQTAQVREMEEYINNSDFQQVQVEPVPRGPAAVARRHFVRATPCKCCLQLMHSLMTEVFTKKPENTIDFMLQWLEKEKERLVDEKLAMQH